tara:strand:- start:3532 stop:4008 length:477 start_codon:yes stop_codon:yes gene_type:complete
MRLIRNLFLCLLVSSCNKVEVQPLNSNQLISHIKTFKGEKAVILNVWALWCVPCVEEFPMIVELGEEIKDLEIVFISADFEDQVDEVITFLNKQKLRSDSFIKREKDESFIFGISPQWSGSLPYTVVYSKEAGIIVDSWEGKKPESRFRAAINIALSS